MAYRKVLSATPGDFAKNTQLAVDFLVEQLGAIRRNHPVYDNLLFLNGRSWWVVPATSNQGVDICNGRDEDAIELLNRIFISQAGILIFRQMVDNRLCIYLIDDLDKLGQRLESSLILLWDTIEIIKSSSDIGIIVGKELIGFRKLLNKQPAPPDPMNKLLMDD